MLRDRARCGLQDRSVRFGLERSPHHPRQAEWRHLGRGNPCGTDPRPAPGRLRRPARGRAMIAPDSDPAGSENLDVQGIVERCASQLLSLTLGTTDTRQVPQQQ